MVDKPKEISGLFCFISPERLCDSDCMAFLPVMPEGADYQGQQWSKCLLLVNAHKAGKHLTVLAQHSDGLLKHLRVVKADAQRGGPSIPPGVR